MKTNVKSTRWLVITGLVFFLAYSAKAESADRVKFYMLQGKKLLVESVNPQQRQITITMMNSKTEEVVYSSDPAYNASFRKYYDLTSLPEDKYTIFVKLDNQVFEK